MTRVRLPQRRPGLSFTMADPNPGSTLLYDVMVGFDTTLAPKEIFISCHKTTTAMDIAGRDLATLISIALQHGADLAELAGAISRDDRGNPQGIAGAALDEVMRQIACV